MIPLLQTKPADTAHTGIFASVTRHFSHFWVGLGDEATVTILDHICNSQISTCVCWILFERRWSADVWATQLTVA